LAKMLCALYFNSMKHIFIAVLLIFIGFSTIQAQTKNEKSVNEIKTLRSELVKAIKQRDRKTLEEIYADDFTHTHASGQIDDKTKRLSALVSGNLTIESAEVGEIDIRIYNKNTAIAVGQSSITDAEKTTKYRWTIVYVKTGKKWKIAASQATKIQ
jgi:hypothetical protein